MRHMNSRRILAMLLALCMMACLLSMTAFAADPLPEDADPDEWDTIVLTKEDGTKLVAGTDYTVTRGTYSHYAYTEPFKYNIYNVTTTDAIVISGGASYSNSSLSNPLKSRISLGAAVTRVTLQNVTALGELSIADGSSVTFTLKNENNIDYIYGKGETTNMTFEGDGSLTGKHIGGVNKYGAAKGTNIGCNITINSGTFNITAGYEAAIGGGQYGDSGKIVINGGNITAKSNYGAAIGGGQNGDAAAIEVSDGEINATGSFGAAIGGGQSGDAKEIGIEGGVINARGSHVGAAIGGGQNGNVGKIEITDGDITVVARNMAIGGETADDISISGGNIKLGKLDSSSKEVTPDASQIGSKNSSETSTVTITGGTFKSTDNVVVNVSAYVPEDCTYNPETGEVTGAPSYVAYIGTQGYTALEAAIEAVQDGETVEIAVSDTYSREALNKLSNQSKNVTIKAREGVVAIIDMSDAVTMSNGGTTTFENITFQYTTANYRGLQHAGNVVYNNCKINGVVFLYGTSEIFNGCVFTQTESGDAYNVWVYGTPHAEFNDCTFNNAGKTIHVYNENNGTDLQLAATDVTLKSCTVKSTKESGNKSVVNIKTDKVPTELKLAGTNKVYYNETDITDATGLYVFSLHQGPEKPDSVKDSNVYQVTENEDGTTTETKIATTAKATGVAKITRNGTDFTYATLAEAFEKAKDGDTITLLSDCSGNGIKVEANKFATGLTVDFGGHIYTFNGTPVGSTGSETQAAHFESGNKITLKNGKFNAAASSDVRILVQNYAELTLSKMELDGTNVAQNGTNLFTLSCNNGNVVIEDSTIKAPAKATGQNVYPYAVDICGFANYDGVSVTVKGTSEINGNIRLASYDAEKARTLKLKLEGGKVSGNLYLGALLDVDRGNTTVTKASSVEMTAPSGYMWDNNGTLVKNAAVVARYGGKDYTSLQEAVDAVTDNGGTLVLKADVHLDEALRIVDKAKTDKLLIQLSGHFIYGPSGGTALYVKNSNVKINGSSAKGAESGIAGGTGGDWDVAIWADDGADVTINGGVYSVGVDKNNGGNSTIYVTGSGKVKILAGRFSSEGTYNGKHYVLNLKNGSSGSITVTGQDAEFEEFNPLAGDDHDGGNFCAKLIGLVASEKDGKKVYTTKSGTYQVLDAENNPVNVYKDVSALMEKVEKGQTVMLLANATANITIPAGKDFTLDLNGKTLNGGTGTAVATITNYGKVTITDSSADKTGKIMRDDAGVEGEKSYYVIRNLGTMTIKNGTIYNNSGYKKANPSGSMEGSSLICNSNDDAHPATLNIEGGTLEQANFIAIKNGSSGTLVMTGGTVKSGHSAIQNWHDATITGGKVIGQLWTDSYIDEFSTGKTVFGGEAKFEGEIVMDITGNIKPTLEIKGGELDVTSWRVTNGAANAGARPEVSGGTFTREVPAGYCKDGFVPATLPGGKYGVEPAKGDVKLIGADGNVRYGSIADAIENETIQLYKDITVDGVYLRTGRTLDLNGWTLTAEYVQANTGRVIDSSDGKGKLIVSDETVTFNVDAEYLPLYDGTEYRFFEYKFELKKAEFTDSTKNVIKLNMWLYFSNLDAYDILIEHADGAHGIDLRFIVSWPQEGKVDQTWELRVPAATISSVYKQVRDTNPQNYGIGLNIKGLNLLPEGTEYIDSMANLRNACWLSDNFVNSNAIKNELN